MAKPENLSTKSDSVDYTIDYAIPVILHNGDIINVNPLNTEQYNELIKNFTADVIGNSLSKLCRYNGQSLEFYSVAEHCIKLALYVIHTPNLSKFYPSFTEEDRIPLAKCLLLHDAAEAFIGDVPYHIKGHLPHFKHLDDTLSRLIYRSFGIEEHMDRLAPIVHDLDKRICFDEMYQLFGKIDPVFYYLRTEPLGIKIENKGHKEALNAFLTIHAKLFGETE